MKTKKSIIALALIALSSMANAQIRYSNNELNINQAQTLTFHKLLINKWPGAYFTLNSSGSNFFQLDITPVNPRISGSGDKVVFYNSQTGKFNSIEVANVYQQSDARSKEAIAPLTSGLAKLTQLNPVTYRWKNDGAPARAAQKLSAAGDSITASAGPECETGNQMGFLAQDVEQVLPEVVLTDEGGYKLVNYTAMIPLLVQSVQELQRTVEAQAAVIEQLSSNARLKAPANSPNKITGCTPNPTSGYTTITLELEDGVTSAEIVISSLTGNREMLVKASGSERSVSVDASMLSQGIHLVSLYVNGNLSDSCRMIKE